MRQLRTLLIVTALLVLSAGGAAKGALPRGGLDRGFGTGGIATAELPGAFEYAAFQVTPDGRTYVLANSMLLAFRGDGTLDREFGADGEVTIAPSFGIEESATADFAIDSQGRILVAGSAPLPGQKVREAYVIRLLPDGSRDPGFGTDGEVDTTFGLPAVEGQGPSVSAVSVTVDAQDRPVLGGSFAKEAEYCSYSTYGGPQPFLARLTSTGALDTTFAESGHTATGGPGGIFSVVSLPGGGLAVLGEPCPTPPRFESRSAVLTDYDESGRPKANAHPVVLGFSYLEPVIDPKGRIVQLESAPPAGEGVDAVSRTLPNGEFDPGFGHKGRAILRHKPHYGIAIAVDAKCRPILALSTKRIVLRRYRTNGKVDRSFGPKGQLTAPGKAPTAIALDARGRIYTLSVSKGTTTSGVQITRFIPGP